ncbi:racemase [Vibrio sp. CAIM 722]|uniref:Racemase n=1 Tax=Vibrio eleionomae TaxID=2653505 RepID=A0A7X4RVN3_9VIBR|nr:aspartate/glutamate racemase family protein [Vibrio eleionomae]MZI94465.1 racemase [Vibrio eleionomae]
MKLKIIIPVNTKEFTDQISDSVDKFRTENITIDLEHIDHGSSFIESRIDLTNNAPYVVEKVIQAEKEGYDGVFVTDMDMCGVEAARQAVTIPVIGGFRASFYTAMLLSQKVSILTVSDVVDLQNEHVRAFGVTENLASIRPLDQSVNDLKGSTCHERKIILHDLFKLACKAIDQDGADSIMFGCTGFTGYAKKLSKKLSAKYGVYVPVMDPNRCAISYLIMLVKNKLSHSGVSYPYISSAE